MSKEETLQRIKQVEAQIRTMKEEAEREREATLRNSRREALELTDQFQQKAEARYREIVSAAETEIASERERLLAAAREDAARMTAQGKANVERAVDLVVGKFRGAIRA
jgi:V/A-type H+-transporting ATPase subunit G/H